MIKSGSKSGKAVNRCLIKNGRLLLDVRLRE